MAVSEDGPKRRKRTTNALAMNFSVNDRVERRLNHQQQCGDGLNSDIHEQAHLFSSQCLRRIKNFQRIDEAEVKAVDNCSKHRNLDPTHRPPPSSTFLVADGPKMVARHSSGIHSAPFNSDAFKNPASHPTPPRRHSRRRDLSAFDPIHLQDEEEFGSWDSEDLRKLAKSLQEWFDSIETGEEFPTTDFQLKFKQCRPSLSSSASSKTTAVNALPKLNIKTSLELRPCEAVLSSIRDHLGVVIHDYDAFRTQKEAEKKTRVKMLRDIHQLNKGMKKVGDGKGNQFLFSNNPLKSFDAKELIEIITSFTTTSTTSTNAASTTKTNSTSATQTSKSNAAVDAGVLDGNSTLASPPMQARNEMKKRLHARPFTNPSASFMDEQTEARVKQRNEFGKWYLPVAQWTTATNHLFDTTSNQSATSSHTKSQMLDLSRYLNDSHVPKTRESNNALNNTTDSVALPSTLHSPPKQSASVEQFLSAAGHVKRRASLSPSANSGNLPPPANNYPNSRAQPTDPLAAATPIPSTTSARIHRRSTATGDQMGRLSQMLNRLLGDQFLLSGLNVR